MSAQVYDFALYQQKATQMHHIQQQGWDRETFRYTPGKPLNIYLVDKHHPCLRFFNCHFNDIHPVESGQNKRLNIFLEGWELISAQEAHRNLKHQNLTFQLAKHVIASLPQWQNLSSKQLSNQLAGHSHLIALIDKQSLSKPVELILVQSDKAFLSPWRIHNLLRENRLRGGNNLQIPVWNFSAEQ